VLSADADTLERLDALLLTLADAHVHADRVAGAEGRDVIPEVLVLSLDERVHVVTLIVGSGEVGEHRQSATWGQRPAPNVNCDRAAPRDRGAARASGAPPARDASRRFSRGPRSAAPGAPAARVPPPGAYTKGGSAAPHRTNPSRPTRGPRWRPAAAAPPRPPPPAPGSHPRRGRNPPARPPPPPTLRPPAGRCPCSARRGG